MECLLDCKTVVFFFSKSEKKVGKAWRKTYARELHMPVGRVRLEQSNKRSETGLKTESETGERR